mgnify:CR=1 FL=1
MFRLFYFLSCLFFYSSFSSVVAQNQNNDYQVYGLNPTLYNGKVYNYFPGIGVKGHQYFQTKEFEKGSLSIRSHIYKNVDLNYDILNQEVILKYTDPQGSFRLLTVSKAWLSKFTIGEEEFLFINSPDSSEFIVQKLNSGHLQMYIHWTKRLIANISFVSEHYVFEEKKQTLYLSYNNLFLEYKNAKTILDVLAPSNQEKVKLYMKKQKIKSRTTSVQEIKLLLDFCNQLIL